MAPNWSVTRRTTRVVSAPSATRVVSSGTIDGTDEDVVDPGGGNDTQSNFAVDAAEGEVVDHVAKGRNVGALGRVKLYDEDVVAAEVQMRRELERKGRVA